MGKEWLALERGTTTANAGQMFTVLAAAAPFHSGLHVRINGGKKGVLQEQQAA
jgi:hypothetical protein